MEIVGKVVVILDILAMLVSASIFPCISNTSSECQKAVSSPISWLIIIIAISNTGFYIYKRSKKRLSLLPFSFLSKPNVSWIYAIYYFFALIFWGENLPEISGYLKGLPLGAVGTHASLMEPSLFFTGDSGTFLNLVGFFAIACAFAFFFRKFNLILAFILSIALGSTVEFMTHLKRPQEIPEGFDLVNNFTGTVLTFIWLWSLMVIVPFIIYQLVNNSWKLKGIKVLIVVMILLNIASYFFFLYERDVLHNILPTENNNQKSYNIQNLPANTCPDNFVIENGNRLVVKDRIKYKIADPEAAGWIQNNCPSLQR